MYPNPSEMGLTKIIQSHQKNSKFALNVQNK